MGLLDKLFKRAPQVVPARVRTLEEFERVVLDSEIPVIVDVWSATCAPCKKLEPILIDVATRYEHRVRIVEIGTAEILDQLKSEMHEEIGRDWPIGVSRPVALVRDLKACSLDVVVWVELDAPVETMRPGGSIADWECAEAKWVRVSGLPDFDRENAGEIIAPTRALFRTFGWV